MLDSSTWLRQPSCEHFCTLVVARSHQVERSKVDASICSAQGYIAPDEPAILRVPGANRTWAAPMGWSPNHAIRMFSGMGRVVGKWWCGRLGIGCDASPAEYRWQGRRMQLQT